LRISCRIAPAHLFDANIFYPERRTLAFSETLLLPSLVVAPLRWIGFGPLLVYNVVFLSGFVLSGSGVALLVRSLTGNGLAGFVAGIVFAFLPYRIDHYPHLQLQQTQCLPFAFWGFHRLLQSARVRDGILFGGFAAGQVLSCMYYGLFLVPFMAVVCAALLIGQKPLTRRHWIALAAGAAIAAVAVLPVGIAYLGAHEVVGERSAEEVERGSALPVNYCRSARVQSRLRDGVETVCGGESGGCSRDSSLSVSRSSRWLARSHEAAKTRSY
jgi:hypothetical protein